MMELWSMIDDFEEPQMNSANLSHLKFPFIFALKELLSLQSYGREGKEEFMEVGIRILSRGYNTDTNCSIALGMTGAALGISSIPDLFVSKVVCCQAGKGCWKGDIVSKLLREGPLLL